MSMQLKQDFKADESVFLFIVKSVFTSAVFYVYWIIRLLEISQSKYNIDEKSIKTPYYLTWIYACLSYFCVAVFSYMAIMALADGEFRLANNISSFTGIISLVSFIILIVTALQIRKIVELIFAHEGIKKDINIILTVIFQCVYIYYVLNKSSIEQNIPSQTPATDITDKLEKLSALLEKGVLSKEEFENEKKKLLEA